MEPINFEVTDLGRFPSDHWGVLTFWEDGPVPPAEFKVQGFNGEVQGSLLGYY